MTTIKNIDTIECLITLPQDEVISEFTSIPGIKNSLHTITEPVKMRPHGNPDDVISHNMGLLVAKTSLEEMLDFDHYCDLHLSDIERQVDVPVIRDYLEQIDANPYLHNSNVLIFLASLASRRNTVTIYYKYTVNSVSQVWTFDASIFDYRNGRSAYTIYEYYDQGSHCIGQYAGYTIYSKFSAEVINGYKGNTKCPPFEIPLIEFIRNFWGTNLHELIT